MSEEKTDLNKLSHTNKRKKRTRTEKEGDKGKEIILHVTTQMQTKLNIVNTFAVLPGLLGAIQQQSISSSRF